MSIYTYVIGEAPRRLRSGGRGARRPLEVFSFLFIFLVFLFFFFFFLFLFSCFICIVFYFLKRFLFFATTIGSILDVPKPRNHWKYFGTIGSVLDICLKHWNHWRYFGTIGSILDVPKPKRNGLAKKVGPFSKRKNPL